MVLIMVGINEFTKRKKKKKNQVIREKKQEKGKL